MKLIGATLQTETLAGDDGVKTGQLTVYVGAAGYIYTTKREAAASIMREKRRAELRVQATNNDILREAHAHKQQRQRDLIIRMLRAGNSFADCARALEVHVSTIRTWAQAWGIKKDGTWLGTNAQNERHLSADTTDNDRHGAVDETNKSAHD